MNKRTFLSTLAMLVLSGAEATGTATPASMPAIGQLWQLTATDKSGLTASIEMKLTRVITPGIPGATIYATDSIFGGGNMNFYSKESGLDATVVMDINLVMRCFASTDATMQQASGYFLQGTNEGANRSLQEAQNNGDHSRGALLQEVRRLSNGTCTLKHLR